MQYKDHDPVIIDQFNGLYMRGRADNTPLDHFQYASNLQSTPGNDIMTRDGLDISQDVEVPLSNVKRIYNYPTVDGSTLIVLTYDPDMDEGNVYHVVNATTTFGPILTIPKMTDIAFVPYAGRGYISPFSSLPPTTPDPSQAPALALAEGNDVNTGVHQYAFTFVTMIGETTPSPIATVTTNTNPIANPTVTPSIFNIGAGTNGLDVGETYKWKLVYTLDVNGTLHTIAGPESVGFVAPASNNNIGLQVSALIPAEATYVEIYRTLGNGAVFFRESQANFRSAFNIVGSGVHVLVGTVTDAVLATRPTEPLANTSSSGNVNISNISIGGADVTSRKVYRTAANATQLKLLTTIADNVTTTFLDDLADGTLGANAPTENTATIPGTNIEKGLQGEFLYVYAGDGTAARKAAGNPLTGTMIVANGNTGHTDPGLHIFGFIAETISGYLTAPALLTSFTTSASQSVSFGNIPTSGDPNVVRRHLVASKVIPTFNGDLQGYQLFFVPDAIIDNNTDTFLNNISFYDADLLDDASDLSDNYAEIPAGAVLTLYHNRLILCTTYDDISLGLVSLVGEPEAISQIDGLFTVTPDGNPITNAQELRDILYVTKRSKTVSFTDNGDAPSSWPLVTVDNALGTSVHGIATVLDSGSSSVDFLIVCTYQGITLFNGRYVTPELSWKIESFWKALNRTEFKRIQVVNAPIQKHIYIVLPDTSVLCGDYTNGMDPKKIRWWPYSFAININTVAIHNIDDIILGAELP